MLDDHVRAVLRRLEEETAAEEGRDLPVSQRSLQVPPTSGALLYALAAGRPGCEVLEIGGSRGYSTIWLGAAVSEFGGHVTSLEADPVKLEASARNIAEARLDEWIDVIPGDAFESLEQLDGPFDLVFLDAWKDDYEALFQLARSTLRGRRRGRRRQRDLARRAGRVLGRPPGRPDARQHHRSHGQRARGDITLDRRVTIELTAERRWSGRWRFPVRAVEVLARRGVSPGPEGESSSQRGG